MVAWAFQGGIIVGPYLTQNVESRRCIDQAVSVKGAAYGAAPSDCATVRPPLFFELTAVVWRIDI